MERLTIPHTGTLCKHGPATMLEGINWGLAQAIRLTAHGLLWLMEHEAVLMEQDSFHNCKRPGPTAFFSQHHSRASLLAAFEPQFIPH